MTKKNKKKANTPETMFLQNEINKILNSNEMIMRGPAESMEPMEHMDEDLTKYKNIIMLVYSDNCGHCTALKPAWEQLKQTRDNNESYRNQIFIKDINAAQNMEDELLTLKTKLLLNATENSVPVDGFPTIGHFRNQQYNPYMGQRDFDSLNRWLGEMIE
jgi:thiol-disulfide isomerase/thioredoxin